MPVRSYIIQAGRGNDFSPEIGRKDKQEAQVIYEQFLTVLSSK
jgi:hypothetical protein